MGPTSASSPHTMGASFASVFGGFTPQGSLGMEREGSRKASLQLFSIGREIISMRGSNFLCGLIQMKEGEEGEF